MNSGVFLLAVFFLQPKPGRRNERKHSRTTLLEFALIRERRAADVTHGFLLSVTGGARVGLNKSTTQNNKPDVSLQHYSLHKYIVDRLQYKTHQYYMYTYVFTQGSLYRVQIQIKYFTGRQPNTVILQSRSQTSELDGTKRFHPDSTVLHMKNVFL